MTRYDVIVIGGGIGGLSIAAEVARKHSVLLLETEAALGTHSTGRSGAVFGRSYGNTVVRALNDRAYEFFLAPPADFTEVPLLRPRPWLFIAREDQEAAAENWRTGGAAVREIDGQTARAMTANLLRPDRIKTGFVDDSCGDIDVHGLMEGYRRLLRQANGTVRLDAGATAMDWRGGAWHVSAGGEVFSAPIVVNAAGAWADKVAEMAGINPLGLTPLRRTAALIDPPAGLDVSGLPVIIDAAEEFYFKPDAGKLMLSPADETPSEACDAYPEEIDVAYAVHHYEEATGNSVRSVSHKWAGLRTFAPDRTPVLGFDHRCEGFFWLAGQGGYGLQTAPALASLGAVAIDDAAKDDPLLLALSPDRLI
jgi:D-arginine dehydrogenase